MRREIKKEEVNRLKKDGFNGEIVVVEEEKDAADICHRFLSKESLLGFDTETRPAFKKGEKYQAALIQIACAETVYLFRINKMGLTQPIADILGDENIMKAGIAIGRDLEELRELKDFEPADFVDLNQLATERGFQSIGVKNLTAMLLGFRVSKRQQTSNWEADVLKPAQARYAATDAWVCREIYLKLLHE